MSIFPPLFFDAFSGHAQIGCVTGPASTTGPGWIATYSLRRAILLYFGSSIDLQHLSPPKPINCFRLAGGLL